MGYFRILFFVISLSFLQTSLGSKTLEYESKEGELVFLKSYLMTMLDGFIK